MSVRELRPATIAPDAELVATLERLLADAKSGTLRGLFGMAEYTHTMLHITVGEYCGYTIAGHLMAVASRVVREAEGDDEDE